MEGSLKKTPILEDLHWGIRWGIYGAVFFTGLAAIPALLRFLLNVEEVDGHRLPSFPVIIGLYLFGGVFGGAIVGLLRPLARSWWGMRLVGIVAAVPFCFAVSVALSGLSWTQENPDFVIEFAIFWGFAMSFAPGDQPKFEWPWSPRR